MCDVKDDVYVPPRRRMASAVPMGESKLRCVLFEADGKEQKTDAWRSLSRTRTVSTGKENDAGRAQVDRVPKDVQDDCKKLDPWWIAKVKAHFAVPGGARATGAS